jgi:two-component system, OmpR family, phosphate regulon sensor histidine kinase PhoR
MKQFLKVFASYLFLVLLTIAALDFFLTPKIVDIVTTSIENEMFGVARIITLMPRDNLEKKIPEIAKQINLRVTLINSAGEVITDSQSNGKKMDNHLNRPEIQQAQKEGQGKASRFSVTLQESMLYVALPMKENAEIKAYIRLARPLVEVKQSLEHLYQVIYLTLFIILLPSLILAVVFSRNIASRLSPVEKVLKKNM